MVRLYKCLNERGISGCGSLNGLADEAVPLCGLEEGRRFERGMTIYGCEHMKNVLQNGGMVTCFTNNWSQQ